MIKRKEFDALDDVSLIWMCIEPTIREIRGRNFAIKSEAYSGLTPGLRALLMVQVLYGHASHGVEEFYSHQSYLLSNQGVWAQLKNGLQYFGDDAMVQILEKMDTVYQRLKAEGSEEGDELYSSIKRINQSLSDTLPLTIKLVAAHIRSHSGEFITVIN